MRLSPSFAYRGLFIRVAFGHAFRFIHDSKLSRNAIRVAPIANRRIQLSHALEPAKHRNANSRMEIIYGREQFSGMETTCGSCKQFPE